MKFELGKIHEDFSRAIYWTRIIFSSEDDKKVSRVLVCSSEEYLDDLYRLSGSERLTQEHFSQWLSSVVDKWLKLGEEIFKQDVHYDVYANTQEGEANGFNYLVQKIVK